MKFKETEIGMIPEDWCHTTLGSLVTFQRGHDLTFENKIEGPYPVVSSSGILGYHNEYKIKGPGVTVGRSGNSLGKAFFVSEDYWPHNTVLYVKKFHNVDPKFLYYLLKSLNLKEYDSGSAVPTLNRNYIHPMSVVVPKKLDEQKAISCILSDLDNKIELNLQMNSTLEQIAQALFKKWFIDFEFPDENGNPYKSSGSRMVDSEFGETPEGWEIKELREFGEIICGKTPSKNKVEYYENGKVSFIKIPDMRNQIFPVKTEDKLSEIGAKSISKKKLPSFSVCVSCIATVGMVCITYEDSSYTNQQINSIIPNEYGPYYLYFKIKELYDKLNLWASGGSATLNLNTSEFSKIRIIGPPKEIINAFNNAIDPIFKEILSNSLEIASLSDIRDSLLPKLMSGKIRVQV